MVMVLVLNDAKNKTCVEKTQKVILDEVIAVDVKVSTNFKIVNDIIWPDIQVKHKKTIEKDLSIAFVSDTHVGSKNFCGAELERMIRWLHGTGPGKEIAEKIGYLLIAGDVVDGIGIYPKQERDLVIKDIYEQYKLFSKLIELVPDHIEIVVIPGNHDAVRIAEPQPAIPNDMIPSDGRIHSIGNPAYVDIEGLRTLMYHGGSIESVIAAVPDMNFTHPDLAAVELLKRRTLDPLYDKNDIAPEHTDYLFIDEVDIFQTGHIHRNAYTEYRGTIVLNSGAWMSQTEYQMKRGIVPTPAILPVYNMKSGRMIHVDFYGQDIKVV
jgi:DNA polymerase II small subunit